MLIVGLDAATDPRKFGYALGFSTSGKVRVVKAGTLRSGACRDALSEFVVPQLRQAKRALIAIDAPLGWPALAGAAFSQHTAGAQIATEPDRLFHRTTDDFGNKWNKWGQTPLKETNNQ